MPDAVMEAPGQSCATRTGVCRKVAMVHAERGVRDAAGTSVLVSSLVAFAVLWAMGGGRRAASPV